jgi:hypothetical protein
MNAANSANDGALNTYLENIRALSHEGKYAEIAEAYNAFIGEHPRMRYHATEPLPFLIGNHLVEKTGKSSAFSTMTIRNPTWTDKLVNAVKTPAEFASYVQKVEADVNAIGQKI